MTGWRPSREPLPWSVSLPLVLALLWALAGCGRKSSFVEVDHSRGVIVIANTTPSTWRVCVEGGVCVPVYSLRDASLSMREAR